MKPDASPLEAWGRLLPDWAEGIAARLRTRVVGSPLLAFDAVGSTSSIAKELANRGAPDGTAVLAREQSAGRGRRGRVWVSHPGKAVYLSALLRPALPAAEAAWPAILGGVAAAEACERIGVPGLSVKWPNDILAGQRKICGVLTEPRLAEERMEFAVLGFGLNVAQLDEDWPASLRGVATSCRALGCPATCEEAIQALLESLDAGYALLRAGRFDALLESWVRWSGTSRLPALD